MLRGAVASALLQRGPTEIFVKHAELAESLGWPVTTLTGGHLDIVNNPVQIAEQIFKLTQRT
jgi:hypothetical protein